MEKLKNYLLSSISYEALCRANTSLFDPLSNESIRSLSIALGMQNMR